MSNLLVSYQPNDPLAQAFWRQLQDWSHDNWDFPTVTAAPQHPNETLSSRQAGLPKRQFRQALKRSPQFLIIISRGSWQSEWVDWEISMAAKLDKQLFATKLDIPYMIPLALWEAHPQWIEPFDPAALSQRHI